MLRTKLQVLGKRLKIRKKIIYGCDSRGDRQSPYLTRWTLFRSSFGAVYLHYFQRSDAPDIHDHPWAFVSIILWRGYVEERPEEKFFLGFKSTVAAYASVGRMPNKYYCGPEDCGQVEFYALLPRKRKRIYPGMILFRRATWEHRVELVNNKPALTLVIRGPYCREWGFYVKQKWVQWQQYFKDNGCEE